MPTGCMRSGRIVDESVASMEFPDSQKGSELAVHSERIHFGEHGHNTSWAHSCVKRKCTLLQ